MAAPDSVPVLRRLPSARTIGLTVGAGRAAIGAIFLAAPVSSVRLLGLDTATATRVTWLARMTAARDGVLGAGTLVSSARREGAGGWLLAGSVSDAVDAVVLVAALRDGKVRGRRAQAITAGAIGAALAAAAAAVDVVRHG
ncbi:MAG: hypothetical protein DLM57_12890 [Pseudonocardiales bacterium]|nr:MAG: hypothetical protein DLM57_12890 [Pseudonocardiales bacterium]